MDFDLDLKWRLGVRIRAGLPLHAVEFLRHGGRYLLVRWRACESAPGTVEVLSQHVVSERFDPVGGRMMQMIEQYYFELEAPTAGFHRGNVKEAMQVASSALDAISELIARCSAPARALSDIFEILRDAVGELARSPEPITEVQAEEHARVALVRMDERLWRAGCVTNRIFA